MRVKTRNGSFANSGHGGGVFNLNTAFGAYEASAQPISGLGEIPATVKKIPERCSQSKAYTDCFNVAWSEATLMCDYCRENPSDYICEGYTDSKNNMLCKRKVSTTMSRDNCVPSFCPSEDESPWATQPDYAPFKPGDGCGTPNTIKNVQFMTGADPDGVWGPNSREAYETNKAVFGTSYCDLVPGCTGLSPVGPGCDGEDPTPVLVAKPTPAPTPAPVVEPQPESDKTMGLLIGGALLGAFMFGAYKLSGKKK